MRIFIIFMTIWFSASFSYADVSRKKFDSTSGMILKTASDQIMYAKSKTSSKKTKSSKSLIRSKSSTRSSSKKKKPYLLKDGCKFTLYTNAGNVTVKNKESEASPAVLEKSGIRIVIQNCKVIENPMNIPVHTHKAWWKFW